MTIGHVPVTTSELAITISASAVQASVIVKLPERASKPATVVSAAGASVAAHPSTTVISIAPAIAGAVTSFTVTKALQVAELPLVSNTFSSTVLITPTLEQSNVFGVTVDKLKSTAQLSVEPFSI